MKSYGPRKYLTNRGELLFHITDKDDQVNRSTEVAAF